MNKIRILIPIILAILFITAGCAPGADYLPIPTSIPLSDPLDGSPNPSSGLIPPENPIYLPQGFQIAVFADGLSSPEKMAIGPDGIIHVTDFETGRVLRLPDRDGNGVVDGFEIAADDLIEPSGLAFFKDGSMYVAETTRVIRLYDQDGDGYFEEREIVVAGFAAGGNTDRTLIFSPDWNNFYLSYGSSCNICREHDQRRASVMRFRIDGTNPKLFTTGLRNVVGMDFTPNNAILWAANIERDGIEGNILPETIYAIYLNANAGWPYCHAGRIIDPELGRRGSCDEDLLTPAYELESHSKPTDILFYRGSQFPEVYDSDLFIALHGSGEGNSAVGYKIIHISLGKGDTRLIQDFAVGWVLEDGSPWGSPTDLLVSEDGSLYVSDDVNGVIYQITYNQ
jgi:glucose/arabinose dehydrogenase